MADSAVGLIFDEMLHGGFAMGATDPEAGAKLGKAKGISLTLRNHITIQNVDEFIADPDRSAVLHAQIDFAPLGTGIHCSPGIFQLFHQSDPAVKLVIYACGFTAGGVRYYLEGKKFIHDGEPLHTLLDQTSTLYTQLHAGSDTTGPVVGAGMLHIGVLGVIELVASIRTMGATSIEESARAIVAFDAFFLGELWESYSRHVTGPEAPLVQVLSSSWATPGARHSVTPRPRLAFSAAALPEGATATVVVIGSGYGGGIAASRLARTGQKVVVLERGKEWRAGDFPNRVEEARNQLQIDGPHGRIGARTGLYDLRHNAEVDVLVGCGLGGTSLINASVSLEPAPTVFDDPCWPQALRDDRTTLLPDGYARARAMLEPALYPDHAPALHKLQVLARSADALGQPFARAPINVAFNDRINAGGVAQSACTLCGDCVTGCNYTAKTTVDLTFLPDAKAHGAEMYTEVTVRWIEQAGDKFHVKWRWTEAPDDAALHTITADVVVLAAGVLGSTEILLRSAERGLAVSPMVGHRLSTNGDYLSFGHNNDTTVHAIGAGDRALSRIGPVGPTITGVISARPGEPLADQYIVEEGAIPGALADGLPRSFTAAAIVLGVNTATTVKARFDQAARTLESLTRPDSGAYVGSVDNTQTFLSIGHDNADGSLALVHDRLRISWPGAGEQPVYNKMRTTTTAATAVTQGISIKEPIWTGALHHHLVTVHPLGGCPMGDDAQHGAVNDRGQVFSGPTGTSVYRGLYIADGAVVPRSLGVNPLLTISALAERAMTLLIRDRGWSEK